MLDQIKDIIEQTPESPERNRMVQGYKNLATFNAIADAFDAIIEGRVARKEKKK